MEAVNLKLECARVLETGDETRGGGAEGMKRGNKAERKTLCLP